SRSASGRSSAWSSSRSSSAQALGVTSSELTARSPELRGEPQPRLFPVAAHRAIVDAERLADLDLRQPAEVAQLDDVRHPAVEPGERLERAVHREDLPGGAPLT